MSTGPVTGLTRRFRNLTGVPSFHYDPIFARAVRAIVRRHRPDVIALELPNSIEPELEWVASCWPTPVAIGRTKTATDSEIGLFPFVPGDSMLEGVLLAQQLNIPRHNVDLDTAGAITRPAVDLPGPELAPAAGQAYFDVLDALEEGAGAPVVIDLAREAFMARRLAVLMAEHDHILWIGGAAHWTRIVRRLELGDFDAPAVALNSATTVTRLRLAPAALYNLTGRIPYLAARYAVRPDRYGEAAVTRTMAVEAARRRHESAEQDQAFELVNTGLHELDRPEPERAAAIDIARMLVYARNLAATSRLGDRPTLGELIGAARAVIGPAYAAQLYLTAMQSVTSEASRACATLDYTLGDTGVDFAVEGRRVHVWSRVPAPSTGDRIVLWFRQAPRRLRAAPAYTDLPSARKKEQLRWFAHPAEESAYEEYVRYVLAVASQTEESDTKSEPFVAGMGEGIDIRSTIRHWKDDAVYIREGERGQLRITNGLIDYSSRRERSAIHRGHGNGITPGWIDPDLRRAGSVSREVTDVTVLQEKPCHVGLRQRELSFVSLDRFTWLRGRSRIHSMTPVIDPLVHLKEMRDNLYEWLDVMFAACARKPFAYFSRYAPSARIRSLARKHRVRLVYKPLALIPQRLRERNRRFRFMCMSESQWEAFQERLGEQKLAWGDASNKPPRIDPVA